MNLSVVSNFLGSLQSLIFSKNDQAPVPLIFLDKILRWFPLVGEYLRVERECLMHGFSEEQTDKLVHGQALKFRGYLQADKRSPRVWAESATAQIIRMAKDKLQLTVEQSPIIQWIQSQVKSNKNQQVTEDQNTSNRRGFHV